MQPKIAIWAPSKGDGRQDVTGAINVLTNADPSAKDELYKDFEFIDDVSGRVLDHELAVKARTLETDFFRKMRVYDKVTRAAATRDGCRVISTTWVDVNKGGQNAPNYRARLVDCELKLDSRLDLFAASPPLEAIRIICSLCANNQYGPQPYQIMTLDVKRAYFYARSRRPVYIEIPIEDFEPGGEHMVGRLNLSLYGTSDATQNWTREYTAFLEKYWFQVRSGVTMQPFFSKQKALLDSARRRLHNHWPNGGFERDTQGNGKDI